MFPSYAKKIIHQLAQDYDNISDHFDITRQHNWSTIQDLIGQYVKKDQNILDLGCGNGRLTKNLPSNINYTGLDISPKLISLARKNNPEHKFQTGDLTNLPFPDHTFDIIFAVASIHHIPSNTLRRQAISEIYRVLKQEGIFIMTNWNLYQPKYLPYFNTNHILDKKMDENDTLIPWKNSAGETVISRYYHAFDLDEIQKLILRKDFNIILNISDKFNLTTVARKR